MKVKNFNAGIAAIGTQIKIGKEKIKCLEVQLYQVVKLSYSFAKIKESSLRLHQKSEALLLKIDIQECLIFELNAAIQELYQKS